MRTPTHSLDRDRLDVKMTPMIDVVFLLLIFFVCTASFQALEESLPTNLSTPSGAAEVEQPLDPELEELESIVVKVRVEAGRLTWQVGEKPCSSLRQVRDALRLLAELNNKLPVILDIGGAAPMGDVVAVYDVCRLVGFQRVQFAASA